MATGRAPTYCWDSCVFISLLTRSGRTKDELENLIALEKLCDEGGCTILTASITIVEVLACMMTPDQETLFQELLQRSNVVPVSVTPRIAGKAREIHDWYRAKGLGIAVPDSIHLATAAHYKVSALHTYDGAGKRKRPTDLLALETPLIAKYPLLIKRPEPPPSSDDQMGPVLGGNLSLQFELK